MKFINKHIKVIYISFIILILIAASIKGYISELGWSAMVIPMGCLGIEAMAGPAGSIIFGLIGTVFTYMAF